MKPRIKIYDSQFGHAPSSFGTGNTGVGSDSFEWYRGPETVGSTVIVTESHFDKLDQIYEPDKIAMILEPPDIFPSAYVRAMKLRDRFQMVLTHDRWLVENLGFTWYPQGGCWCLPDDQQIYPKTGNVCQIYSDKMGTYGHQLRHRVVEKFGDKVMCSKRVAYKPPFLRDFRFQLVIENSRCAGYFTEKIIDSFRCGCIPIYWGDPDIGRFFDMDGIIVLPTHDELDSYISDSALDALPVILEKATPEFYESKLPAIRTNFKISAKFCTPEDWLWEHVFRPLSVF